MDQKLANEFKEILEDNGYDVYSYSGRAMYGEKCLAFDFDGSIIAQVAQLSTEILNYCYDNYDQSVDEFSNKAEDFFDLLSTGKTDNMGLGTVIYFPEIKWSKDWEESEEEEGED